MNEYEKIIKIMVENVSAGKMTKEDAVAILTSLFNIAENNRISIGKDFKPYVTWTDVSTSAESLLKKAKTLPYGENKKEG